MTIKAADATLADLRFTPEELLLTWKNDTFSVFHALWLRDNDPAHRDLQTGQRTVSLTELPEDPCIEAVEQSPSGHITLRWDDGASSIFPLPWLRTVDREQRIRARPMRLPWMGQPAASFAWCGYEEWVTSPTARENWLDRAARDGIAFLRDVPQRDQALLEIAGDIGYVRETNYGRVFDVRNVLPPNNPDHSRVGLRVHTADPYRDPVPGFRLLHCLAATGEGGQCLFVDGLAVAERLRARDPDAFTLLSQTLIRYRLRDEHVDLFAERTMIDLDPQGHFRAIHYDDRSIAPLSLAPPLLKRYYPAYRHLARLLEEPRRQVTYLLQPGDLVLLDNARVLHGRTAFSFPAKDTLSQQWHLQGCYLDADGLYSSLALLARKGNLP